MKFPAFVDAIAHLVKEWAIPPNEIGELLPREQLKVIYDEVRNSCAHELAEALEQRDQAMIKLHKRYLREGGKS
jgi:hypothetical protein